MKKNIIQVVMILIVLSLAACRTSKFSNRQKNRVAVEEQSEFRTRLQEDTHFARSATITDSSGQSYQLTIFPLDAFTFSLQNGFKGTASKVVVSGSSKKMIHMSDSSKFEGSVSSKTGGKMTRDLNAKMRDTSVRVEGSGGIWSGIGLGIIGGLVILGIWRKCRWR